MCPVALDTVNVYQVVLGETYFVGLAGDVRPLRAERLGLVKGRGRHGCKIAIDSNDLREKRKKMNSQSLNNKLVTLNSLIMAIKAAVQTKKHATNVARTMLRPALDLRLSVRSPLISRDFDTDLGWIRGRIMGQIQG